MCVCYSLIFEAIMVNKIFKYFNPEIETHYNVIHDLFLYKKNSKILFFSNLINWKLYGTSCNILTQATLNPFGDCVFTICRHWIRYLIYLRVPVAIFITFLKVKYTNSKHARINPINCMPPESIWVACEQPSKPHIIYTIENGCHKYLVNVSYQNMYTCIVVINKI